MNPVTSAPRIDLATSGGLSGSPTRARASQREARRRRSLARPARLASPRLLLDRLDAAGEQAQRETQQAQTCTSMVDCHRRSFPGCGACHGSSDEKNVVDNVALDRGMRPLSSAWLTKPDNRPATR